MLNNQCSVYILQSHTLLSFFFSLLFAFFAKRLKRIVWHFGEMISFACLCRDYIWCMTRCHSAHLILRENRFHKMSNCPVFWYKIICKKKICFLLWKDYDYNRFCTGFKMLLRYEKVVHFEGFCLEKWLTLSRLGIFLCVESSMCNQSKLKPLPAHGECIYDDLLLPKLNGSLQYLD